MHSPRFFNMKRRNKYFSALAFAVVVVGTKWCTVNFRDAVVIRTTKEEQVIEALSANLSTNDTGDSSTKSLSTKRQQETSIGNPYYVNENRRDNRKSPFIIHIGPPKTGTTTLQADFQRLFDQPGENTKKIGGYLFLGKVKNGRRFNNAMYNSLLNENCLRALQAHYERQKAQSVPRNYGGSLPCWREFERKLVDLHCSGTNATADCQGILLSDEVMGGDVLHNKQGKAKKTRFGVSLYPAFVEALAALLQQENFDVTIVATYRRLAEQLVSAYKMFYQPRYSRATGWPRFQEGEIPELAGTCPHPWNTVRTWY